MMKVNSNRIQLMLVICSGLFVVSPLSEESTRRRISYYITIAALNTSKT